MRLQAFKAKKATKEGNNPTTGAPPHPNLDTPVGEDDLSDRDTDTRDDPTNLETRRVDVPLVVAVDVHPPPIPSPLQCDICGQTFGKRAGLNGHMRKKHERIEQIDGAQEVLHNFPYAQCLVCDIFLKDKNTTTNHYREVHNNSWKNIVLSICQHCGMSFNRGRVSVDEHIMKEHSDLV